MMREMTYEQFAKERGLVTDYDVQGHIHGGLMAAHMPKSYHRWFQKRLIELQVERSRGIREYKMAIEDALIAPPADLSYRERLEMGAAGHPDLPSTQASIRLLYRLNSQESQSANSNEP